MARNNPPRCEYIMKLEDGRDIGVAEFGPESGTAIFWFHGTPGARRQVPITARKYVNEKGLRLISTERPGIGDSSRHLYTQILDYARDIEELADKLGLDKFGVIGLSGGGPYALACAHALDGRVIAGSVLGGVAPTLGEDAPEGGQTARAIPAEKHLTRIHKPLSGLISRIVKAMHPFSDPIFDYVLKMFPGPETEMLRRPEMRSMFLDDMLRGTKSGVHSALYDIILFARPWGFSIRDIEAPIHFWHGTEDPMVPHDHATHLAEIIPNAQVTLCHDDGHLAGLDTTIEAIEFILSHHDECEA